MPAEVRNTPLSPAKVCGIHPRLTLRTNLGRIDAINCPAQLSPPYFS